VAASSQPDLEGSTSTGVDPRISALLCYAAWWLSGLIFLIIEQRHRTVRFHAAQSLVLFGGLTMLIGLLSVMSVAMLIVSGSAFQAARILVYVVWIAAVAVWLVLMYRTLQGETWQVPFVAGLAQKIAER
jgi:uncharacterized membrane protein